MEMNEKLRGHIETLFADAPQTPRIVELKEEMLLNLTDKYSDLRAEGKSEDAAYNIAVASIGDVSGLIRDAQTNVPQEAVEDEKKRRLLLTISVMLYILSVIPVLLLQNETGVILMFVIIAIATGLIIYRGQMPRRYVGQDGTVVDEFRAWQQTNSKSVQAEKAVTSCVWMLATCVYFAVSFYTGAWHITWLVFLIAGAVNTAIRGVFDLNR